MTVLFRVIISVSLLWTLILGVSLYWNIINERRQVIQLARKEAIANFNKDQSFRFWAARHGGVYVPPDDRTPPNPALALIPDRDIVSNFGKKYTLMNPAYMLRQLMEEYGEAYGIRGHITSLKLLNPKNAPDEWEKKNLYAFERGVEEVFEIGSIGDKPYLRLMRPMKVKNDCLKCHGYQGYRVGDVRGGVSISVPMSPYHKILDRTAKMLILSHAAFWIVGLIGIGLVYIQGRRRIVELSKADEELHATQKRLSSITSVLGEGVYMLDKESNLIFMNPEAEHLLGWSESELLGMNIHEKIHFQKADGTRIPIEECPVERVVNSGKSIRIDDDVFTKKDGTIFSVSYVSTPVIEDGTVTASVTAFQDITQKKMAERAISESEERWRSIAENSSDYITIIDTDANVIFVNRRLAGLRREDMYGRSLFDYIPPRFSITAREAIDRVIKTGKQDRFEIEILGEDGGTRYFETRVGAIIPAERIIALTLSSTDITERKLMVNKLQDLNLNLEKKIVEEVEKSRQKDHFVHEQSKQLAIGELLINIAHHWRQPLNAIGVLVQNIEDDFIHKTLNKDELHDSVNIVMDELTRLSEVIKTLGGLYRPVKERLDFDLSGTVHKCLAILDPQFKSANIHIELRLQDGLYITGSQVNMSQVIMKIVTNSIDAIRDSNIGNGYISINLDRDEASSKTLLTISDNGGGIDEAILERIFDPYFTTRFKTRDKGMGLFMVKTIVESEMGGNLRVRNTSDGVDFTVEI